MPSQQQIEQQIAQVRSRMSRRASALGQELVHLENDVKDWLSPRDWLHRKGIQWITGGFLVGLLFGIRKRER